MGGHGALISFLKNPSKYKSVSAFAPICNPVECPWGKFAFSGYLGKEESLWKVYLMISLARANAFILKIYYVKEYDATHLVKNYSGSECTILIDQGKEDDFLKKEQLLPDNLTLACKNENKLVTINLRYQEVINFI